MKLNIFYLLIFLFSVLWANVKYGSEIISKQQINVLVVSQKSYKWTLPLFVGVIKRISTTINFYYYKSASKIVLYTHFYKMLISKSNFWLPLLIFTFLLLFESLETTGKNQANSDMKITQSRKIFYNSLVLRHWDCYENSL